MEHRGTVNQLIIMADLSADANAQSLSEMYEECIRSFKGFLRALNEEGCYVIRSEEVHLPEILEEFGRTKIWGNQAKSNLPAKARGSLDDMLWNDDELKQLTRHILKRLRTLLDQGKYDSWRRGDCSLTLFQQHPSPKGRMMYRIKYRSAVSAPTRILIPMVIVNNNVRGYQRFAYSFSRLKGGYEHSTICLLCFAVQRLQINTFALLVRSSRQPRRVTRTRCHSVLVLAAWTTVT